MIKTIVGLKCCPPALLEPPLQRQYPKRPEPWAAHNHQRTDQHVSTQVTAAWYRCWSENAKASCQNLSFCSQTLSQRYGEPVQQQNGEHRSSPQPSHEIQHVHQEFVPEWILGSGGAGVSVFPLFPWRVFWGKGHLFIFLKFLSKQRACGWGVCTFLSDSPALPGASVQAGSERLALVWVQTSGSGPEHHRPAGDNGRPGAHGCQTVVIPRPLRSLGVSSWFFFVSPLLSQISVFSFIFELVLFQSYIVSRVALVRFFWASCHTNVTKARHAWSTSVDFGLRLPFSCKYLSINTVVSCFDLQWQLRFLKCYLKLCLYS